MPSRLRAEYFKKIGDNSMLVNMKMRRYRPVEMFRNASICFDKNNVFLSRYVPFEVSRNGS